MVMIMSSLVLLKLDPSPITFMFPCWRFNFIYETSRKLIYVKTNFLISTPEIRYDTFINGLYVGL